MQLFEYVLVQCILIFPILVYSQQDKPNIILIVADDMGYSDIGCYGGEIETPNLDRLAEDGIRFRQFYNGARCCPSRASLMTGLYPHQTGIGHMTNDPEDSQKFNYGFPSYEGDLNNNCVTIAEVLRSANYNTLMSGKWHLGMHDKEKWPLQRGFDKFYGILAGASNYFNPIGGRGLTLMNDPIKPDGEDFYITDAFTDYALSFISEVNNDPDPFFLFLSYTSPHWPLNALEKDIEKYRNTYQNGWEVLRRERYQKMMSLGVIDNHTVLSDDDAIKWVSLSEEEKDEMDFRMAIYAAQIDRMDQNIGRLIDYLEKTDQFENTLILFFGDNGACAEGGMLGGGDKEILGTKEGYFLTYGQAWANVSATPFRKYKHWVHEGGICTPLIVHWPERIKSDDKGTFTDHYGFLQDIMATIIDVSGAEYPKYYNGKDIYPMVGKSMLHIINGVDSMIHNEPIFWEHEGNGAVRLGNYKLVKSYKPDNPEDWELYNLKDDRSEVNNIALEYPELVRKLQLHYKEWSDETGVLPWQKILSIIQNKNNE